MPVFVHILCTWTCYMAYHQFYYARPIFSEVLCCFMEGSRVLSMQLYSLLGRSDCWLLFSIFVWKHYSLFRTWFGTGLLWFCALQFFYCAYLRVLINNKNCSSIQHAMQRNKFVCSKIKCLQWSSALDLFLISACAKRHCFGGRLETCLTRTRQLRSSCSLVLIGCPDWH